MLTTLTPDQIHSFTARRLIHCAIFPEDIPSIRSAYVDFLICAVYGPRHQIEERLACGLWKDPFGTPLLPYQAQDLLLWAIEQHAVDDISHWFPNFKPIPWKDPFVEASKAIHEQVPGFIMTPYIPLMVLHPIARHEIISHQPMGMPRDPNENLERFWMKSPTDQP